MGLAKLEAWCSGETDVITAPGKAARRPHPSLPYGGIGPSHRLLPPSLPFPLVPLGFPARAHQVWIGCLLIDDRLLPLLSLSSPAQCLMSPTLPPRALLSSPLPHSGPHRVSGLSPAHAISEQFRGAPNSPAGPSARPGRARAAVRFGPAPGLLCVNRLRPCLCFLMWDMGTKSGSQSPTLCLPPNTSLPGGGFRAAMCAGRGAGMPGRPSLGGLWLQFYGAWSSRRRPLGWPAR